MVFWKFTLSILYKKKPWPHFIWFTCLSGSLYGYSSVVYRLQGHSEDLLLTIKSTWILILIRLTFEGWKTEAVFQPSYGFESGTCTLTTRLFKLCKLLLAFCHAEIELYLEYIFVYTLSIYVQTRIYTWSILHFKTSKKV